MSDLVERLRATTDGETVNPDGLEAADRIEKLEDDNASLASWQCEFTDGKTGLVYGEGGSTYCAMAKRVQKLEAALDEQVQWVKDLADSLMEAEGKIGVKNARIEQLEAALKPLCCTCDRAASDECSRSEVNCPFWNARAALEVHSIGHEDGLCPRERA